MGNSILDRNKADYLENPGIGNSLDEKFAWNVKTPSIKKWLEEGASTEDAADFPFDLIKNIGRFDNHFHAPARGWAGLLPNDLFDAGLDDDVYIRHTGGEIVC